MLKKKSSLFRRYFSVTAAIVLAGFIAIGLTMVTTVSVQWWNEKVDVLTNNAQDICDIVSSYDISDNIDENTQNIISGTLEIMSNATSSDYFLTDRNGKIIICSECNHGKTVADCEKHKDLVVSPEYMERALASGFSDYATDDPIGKGTVGKFIVGVPIEVDGKTVAVSFAVEDAISGLLPYVGSITQTISIAVLIGLIIAFIALYFVAKGVTEPLSEMQEVTKHFAKGEFDHRANESYKRGNMSEFARALNKMADELAIDEEAQRSFVANVSHELKTPMTTIGGFIDGILDGTIPPAQEKEYLSIVSNEVKRLSRIVVSMLNLSKIEAGEVSLSPVKYDVGSQIFETLLSFEKRIEEKHINIDGFEEMGQVYLNGDRDLIQQVIYNLLDNAVKFTPDGGTISLYAKNEDGNTVVRIRNSGAGVSQEEISRIFERFYKVDKSRSYDVKGVGLGLYIVKTIVNMHDGEITASSKKGEYTEFKFEIPNLS